MIGPPLARRPYRFGGCTHPLFMPRKRGLSSGWSRQERGQVNLPATLRLTRRTVLHTQKLIFDFGIEYTSELVAILSRSILHIAQLQMTRNLRYTVLFLIITLSLVMHFEHLSKDLMGMHVWRQTQTQSTINSFFEEDMNILNPRRNARGEGDGIYRIEFPLMQWLVAATYKIVGNSVFITRGLMFIIGLITILGMYKFLLELFQNTLLAIIGAWTFNFSPSFYYYTINPLPDNLALCCSVWGIAMFFNWYRTRQLRSLYISGILLSVGALVKLPFILYFTVPVTYFIIHLRQKSKDKKLMINQLLAYIFIVLPLAWYISVISAWKGNVVIKGMLNNQDTIRTTLDNLVHNLIVALPELLLNYGSLLFFLLGFYFLIRRKTYENPKFILLLVLSLVVLLYFFYELNMIRKAHDYYLFPFYPLLFALVSYGAYNLLKSNQKIWGYLTILLLVIIPITCYLRMQGAWNPDSPGFNKDLLIYKEDLRTAIPDKSLVVAGNDQSNFIFLYYINKKGWGYSDDKLTAEMLNEMIKRGAEYLYTDSRQIDHNPEIINMLEVLVLERNTIKIYKLNR